MVMITHRLPIFVDGEFAFFVAQEAVSCPICEGRGWSVNSARDQRGISACRLCGGRGWVPVEVCGACGRPAWKWADGIWHCGTPVGKTERTCLEELEDRKKFPNTTYPLGPKWNMGGDEDYTCMC